LKTFVYILFLAISPALLFSQIMIKGRIYEPDSLTPMPFVYIINKSTGNGTMSNAEAKFNLVVNSTDTLICSYVGYARQIIPVSSLKPGAIDEYKIIMRTKMIQLGEVTVSTFKYKPYEKEYMNKIINESQIRTIDAFNSPITALYMQFSKRGKEVRKLAQIFNEILIEEQVNKKLNAEIVRNLTGDPNLDYEHFRKYCLELSNYYIINHDGYELYNKVMNCYKRYKSEGR